MEIRIKTHAEFQDERVTIMITGDRDEASEVASRLTFNNRNQIEAHNSALRSMEKERDAALLALERLRVERENIDRQRKIEKERAKEIQDWAERSELLAEEAALKVAEIREIVNRVLGSYENMTTALNDIAAVLDRKGANEASVE